VADWTEWNIPLASFNPVDRNSVQSLSINFGDSGNSTPGGTGTVYFDDIRLYPARCVPDKIKPAYDFSNNCIVDLADVAMMVQQWLRSDVNFADMGITVQEPSSSGLVGWWKLDGDATDSSGKGNHGTAEGTYSWVAGHDGQAIEFVSGRVLVPDDATLRPASTVSAAAWINYTGDPGDSSRVVVKGRNDVEAYAIEMGGDNDCTCYVGDVNGTRYFADGEPGTAPPDEWLHLACTYDGSTVKLYVDGLVEGSAEADSIPLSQDANGLAIGNRSDANDRPYHGKVDDVRVYNYALSQAEVAWLATDGGGYMPLTSAANIYDSEPEGSKAINFRDFAELTTKWLEKKYWP